MAGNFDIPFKLDFTDFNTVFAEYIKVSSRDNAAAANTKAFYIARRAVHETPRADKLKIGKSLSALIYDFGGKNRKTRTVTRYRRNGQSHQAPVVALLINAQRKRQGKPGLYGSKMKKASANFIANRQRTSSYIKSGWLPAIKTLAPLADQKSAPPMGDEPKRYGAAKGRVIPAVPGILTVALIANSVGAAGKQSAKHSAALQKYGGPALQRAIDAETVSMLQYLNDRAYDTARKLGIAAKR